MPDCLLSKNAKALWAWLRNQIAHTCSHEGSSRSCSFTRPEKVGGHSGRWSLAVSLRSRRNNRSACATANCEPLPTLGQHCCRYNTLICDTLDPASSSFRSVG